MALTAEQLADMQADLGIESDGAVFTNTELNRLYTRAEEDYALAVYYGYRQLLADANKLYDYTAGQTRVEHSQVREHLEKAADFWRAESGAMPSASAVGKTALRYTIDFSYPTTPIENEWESRVDEAS